MVHDEPNSSWNTCDVVWYLNPLACRSQLAQILGEVGLVRVKLTIGLVYATEDP